MAIEDLVVVGRCKYGRTLKLKSDIAVNKAMSGTETYASEEIEQLLKYVREGDTVIDIGAAYGSHTLAFAGAVGIRGRVWAFEPQRFLGGLLLGTMSLNGFVNVSYREAALGEVEGTAYVGNADYARPGNFAAMRLRKKPSEGSAVPLLRLDSLGMTRINLLKIDVCGDEHAVLRGAQETISRLKPVVFVDCAGRERDHTALVRSLLNDLGYTTRIVANGLIALP